MRTELPRTTSASQLKAYALCPRKYFLGYVLEKEPEFRSTSLLLGSAVHGALGWFFGEKLRGNRPEPREAEEILTADLLAVVAGENVRWKSATFSSLEEEGRRLVQLYLETHAALPVAAVEETFEVDIVHPRTGEALGRPLRGYYDLRLEDGTVVEIKTSSKSWNEDSFLRHLQIGGYAYAARRSARTPAPLAVHVLVKLKRAPRIETRVVERSDAELGWWIRAAAEIEQAIGAGLFPPSPSPLCIECEHARACARMGPGPSVRAAAPPRGADRARHLPVLG